MFNLSLILTLLILAVVLNFKTKDLQDKFYNTPYRLKAVMVLYLFIIVAVIITGIGFLSSYFFNFEFNFENSIYVYTSLMVFFELVQRTLKYFGIGRKNNQDFNKV